MSCSTARCFCPHGETGGALPAAFGTGRHTACVLCLSPSMLLRQARESNGGMRGIGLDQGYLLCFRALARVCRVLLARSVARHPPKAHSLNTLRPLALRLHKPHSRLHSQCAGLPTRLCTGPHSRSNFPQLDAAISCFHFLGSLSRWIFPVNNPGQIKNAELACHVVCPLGKGATDRPPSRNGLGIHELGCH